MPSAQARLDAFYGGMFRRLSNSLCVRGISKQKKPEHKTTTDYFSAMNANHHLNFIRSFSALRPLLLLAFVNWPCQRASARKTFWTPPFPSPIVVPEPHRLHAYSDCSLLPLRHLPDRRKPAPIGRIFRWKSDSGLVRAGFRGDRRIERWCLVSTLARLSGIRSVRYLGFSF